METELLKGDRATSAGNFGPAGRGQRRVAAGVSDFERSLRKQRQ